MTDAPASLTLNNSWANERIDLATQLAQELHAAQCDLQTLLTDGKQKQRGKTFLQNCSSVVSAESAEAAMDDKHNHGQNKANILSPHSPAKSPNQKATRWQPSAAARHISKFDLWHGLDRQKSKKSNGINSKFDSWSALSKQTGLRADAQYRGESRVNESTGVQTDSCVNISTKDAPTSQHRTIAGTCLGRKKPESALIPH